MAQYFGSTSGYQDMETIGTFCSCFLPCRFVQRLHRSTIHQIFNTFLKIKINSSIKYSKTLWSREEAPFFTLSSTLYSHHFLSVIFTEILTEASPLFCLLQKCLQVCRRRIKTGTCRSRSSTWIRRGLSSWELEQGGVTRPPDWRGLYRDYLMSRALPCN